MGKRLSAFLKGLASTIDVWPAPAPPITPMSAEERMRRVWERMGQYFQRGIDGYESAPLSAINSHILNDKNG